MPRSDKRRASLPERIGLAIQKSRSGLGWSQATLAERLDLSAKFIGHLERGERLPSVETLFEAARLLDINLDALVVGDDVQATRAASQATALFAAVDPSYQPLVVAVLRAAAAAKKPSQPPGRRPRER